MKLSAETIEVLKNYSTINQNLLIKEGNQLNTVSIMKNIISKATIPDTFPKEFALYDLNEFLAALSLFEVPTLTFNDNNITIKEESGTSELVYFYSDPSIVVSPKNDIKMPEASVNFRLTSRDFTKVQKSAAVLGITDLMLKTEVTGNIILTVKDRKNDTSNDFSIVVGTGATASKEYFFKTENLELLPGEYDVAISDKGISKFKNVNKEVEYFIALEASV